VSIEEICKKAKTSRVTYYKYFPNKEKLALELLKTEVENSFEEFDRIMNSEEDFESKVQKTIQMKIRGTKNISLEFMHDIHDGDFKELQEYLVKSTSRSKQKITDYFLLARSKGEIRKDIKMEFIMLFLDHLQNIIYDERLESIYNSPTDAIGDVTSFFFYGVIGK
jgi:AcrR family transcriptional regulator